jgi:hypothetical protein
MSLIHSNALLAKGIVSITIEEIEKAKENR